MFYFLVILDIDECNGLIPPCLSGQVCTNAPGGYLCEKLKCEAGPTVVPYMGRAECCKKEPGKQAKSAFIVAHKFVDNTFVEILHAHIYRL